MSADEKIRGIQVLFAGRVQGVWFRAWTAEEAASLGVEGWVRNLRSGEVEAAFTGPRDAVEALIEACRDGPPLARVDHVRIVELSGEDIAELVGGGFVQRPTA